MSSLPSRLLPKCKLNVRTSMRAWEKSREHSTLVELLDNLHTHDGCACFTSADDIVSQLQTRNERSPPDMNSHSSWVVFIQDADSATRLVTTPLECCRGVFISAATIQQTVVDKLSARVPCCRCHRPVLAVKQTFCFSVENLISGTERKLISVGRPSILFSKISVPIDWQKYRIQSERCEDETSLDDVVVIPRQPELQFRRLLSDSVLFLDLDTRTEISDMLLMCIAHHTPLIVNKTVSAVEYLGEKYPLFVDDHDKKQVDSVALLDVDLLAKASDYIANVAHKSRERFLRDIQKSAIYRSLPIPLSQKRQQRQLKYWKEYDLTILICTYTRTQNLPDILNRLCQQDFKGSFEVVIWNNNERTHEFVERVYGEYAGQLDLKLQLSSENYYCMPRLSAASLMQSDILITCDDDVLPERTYVSQFVEKHKEYGGETVLCCSGHSFVPHRLDDENPDRFWSKQERTLKTFHNTTSPDSEVPHDQKHQLELHMRD
ncbi:uncharacterized protein LOC134186635 isoform X2 [Corticium candelabrum]|uniref:uncharacterized protein LOC134186635 isoform X2 n=1 Tax=Corticium candelabrum TaxID=121492 RepID=UPI002E253797|nr:uncharacterized protein LOC134186635 isoform X2 [Corticium candelabrum]